MFRRALLRATSGLGALAVAGCSGGADGPAFEEGFEDGLGGWESGAAIGPEVELQDFEWEVGVSGTEAGSGERSLRIWNEGDHDDGVTWGGASGPRRTRQGERNHGHGPVLERIGVFQRPPGCGDAARTATPGRRRGFPAAGRE